MIRIRNGGRGSTSICRRSRGTGHGATCACCARTPFASAPAPPVRKRPDASISHSPTADRQRGRPMFDYLIVGAGFAGSVMAERLAEDGGKKVLVIDKR